MIITYIGEYPSQTSRKLKGSGITAEGERKRETDFITTKVSIEVVPQAAHPRQSFTEITKTGKKESDK